jgi:hypothetical protein
MASPIYFIIACNKLDEPLYFVLFSGVSSNTSAGWIELKGLGNHGPSTKATYNSFILLFNFEFYFSMLSIDCFKASPVASWNYAIFYGAATSKSIEYFHLFIDLLFLVFTFSSNNFLVS